MLLQKVREGWENMKVNLDLLTYKQSINDNGISKRVESFEKFKEKIKNRSKDSSEMRRFISEVRGK